MNLKGETQDSDCGCVRMLKCQKKRLSYVFFLLWLEVAICFIKLPNSTFSIRFQTLNSSMIWYLLFFHHCPDIFFLSCVGSSLLRAGFLQLRRAGAALPCSARASHCGGFSCCGAPALGVRVSAVEARRLQSAGSVVVAHGLSCSMACGIFPEEGSNPCPLHWQADS